MLLISFAKNPSQLVHFLDVYKLLQIYVRTQHSVLFCVCIYVYKTKVDVVD